MQVDDTEIGICVAQMNVIGVSVAAWLDLTNDKDVVIHSGLIKKDEKILEVLWGLPSLSLI